MATGNYVPPSVPVSSDDRTIEMRTIMDTATIEWDLSVPGEIAASVDPAGIKLDDLGEPDDNTDLNATTSAHGLLPKLDGAVTKYLRGDGAWAIPAGGGGGGTVNTIVPGTAIDVDDTDPANPTVAVILGPGAAEACAGNDARLSDARTPTGAAGGDLTGTYPNPTIDAGKVTFAKMQPISTDVLLGNDAAGTTVQEIACTPFARTILDDANAGAVRTTIGAGTGNGSVTSVDSALPVSTFSASSGAVTGAGTLTFTFVNQDANKVFAGPASGGAATPAWRVLVVADIPDISGTYLTVAAAAAGYQPLDTDLAAIAALTTTAFGRALLELANAAAGRTALGLGSAAVEAASAFQPSDADLTAIAALTTTAFGRALLTEANAASIRATIGAGTGNGTVTSVSGTAPIASSGGAAPAISLNDGGVTLAKMADVATATVFYRKTASTGVPEVQLLSTLKTDLGLTGTNSGDQDLSGLLVKASNLSDLASAAVARGNLGLGDMATRGPAPDPGDSTAVTLADLVADYNTLLANLRAAGHI